jgi:Aspartyl protease
MEQEEARCMHNTCKAISQSLYNDDIDAPGTDSDNEIKIHLEQKPLSFADIKPGADTPMTIIVIATIQGAESKRPLRALVDTGSKHTFIYKDALPHAVQPTQVKGIRTSLLDKTTIIDQVVQFDDMVLPELNATKHITKSFTAYVANSQSHHFDVILGQDFNIALGLDVMNSQKLITWGGDQTPFRVIPARTERFRAMQQAYINAYSPREEEFVPKHCLVTEILGAKYDKQDTDQVADQQCHLSPEQREQLKQLLRQFPRLFRGELGTSKYPHQKVSITLQDGAKPVRKRAYPVP